MSRHAARSRAVPDAPPPDPAHPPGELARALVRWQRVHGRHDLPWQRTRDPYRVWLSEIMLQQTQVATVLPYYARFLERFPDVAALARAHVDEVLACWSGLGYYRRAHHLHACARAVLERHGGVFPADAHALAQLPGIGRSTAAAIAVFGAGARAAILDGNVKRVLCRVFGVAGDPTRPAVERALWALAERELAREDVESYTQGLMDLGATVCTRARPGCAHCPLAGRCVARCSGRVDELPTPRARRDAPLRHAALLVAFDAGEVLLEKRPDEGIWGGLWSVPQTAFADAPLARDALERWAREQLGDASAPAQVLAPLAHAFTHFRLSATPVVVQVGRATRARLAEAPGRLWLACSELAHAALPRPVKTLLGALGSDLLAAPTAPRGS